MSSNRCFDFSECSMNNPSSLKWNFFGASGMIQFYSGKNCKGSMIAFNKKSGKTNQVCGGMNDRISSFMIGPTTKKKLATYKFCLEKDGCVYHPGNSTTVCTAD